MNCERGRELFSEYLEDGVDIALSAVVRDHLSECPACSREFDGFKQTLSVLNKLPEIEAPRSFRHDIVIRAAREQHERTRVAGRNSLASNWDALFGRFIPARAIAVACAMAALAVVLLRLPESAYVHFTSMFSPGVDITQSVDTRSKMTSSLQMETPLKQEWVTRKLGRNTIWVSVSAHETGNGSTLYRVMLSINKDALLADETTQRIGAQVHLLPANHFGFSDVDSASAIWSGNILEDSPVVVPVIVDQSQGRSGTVNLLVAWTFRHRQFGSVVMIPTQRPGRSGGMYDFSASGGDFAQCESSLYSALQSISQDYSVPVIANAYLTEKPAVINLGRGDLNETLNEVLKPTSLDWLYANNAVYVDRGYDIQ
ncbi:MAG: anti-sigma factor [Armatimonadetes bacterium]|nr:anti-sigma factor [Armatimonadota bacterium]